MKKPAKVVLGIVTLWPLLYMVIFFVFVFSQIFVFSQTSARPSMPPTGFFVLFGLHFLTMLLIIALSIIYIVNVFKNDRVDKDKKALWAVVLFLGNMFAMPVYRYLYIWREPEKF